MPLYALNVPRPHGFDGNFDRIVCRVRCRHSTANILKVRALHAGTAVSPCSSTAFTHGVPSVAYSGKMPQEDVNPLLPLQNCTLSRKEPPASTQAVAARFFFDFLYEMFCTVSQAERASATTICRFCFVFQSFAEGMKVLPVRGSNNRWRFSFRRP